MIGGGNVQVRLLTGGVTVAYPRNQRSERRIKRNRRSVGHNLIGPGVPIRAGVDAVEVVRRYMPILTDLGDGPLRLPREVIRIERASASRRVQ